MKEQHADKPTVLVLAAGRSTRFGAANKLLADLGGSPVLACTLRAATIAGRVVVVTGHDHGVIEHVARAEGADMVHHPDFDRGMGSSIAAGVRGTSNAAGWLVWPGDLPFVRADTVMAVLRAADGSRPVVPVYRGSRGHPVYFPPSWAALLLQLDGDRGARNFTAGAFFLDVDDPGILRDLDTRSAVEAAG